jgi:hypothetical protein
VEEKTGFLEGLTFWGFAFGREIEAQKLILLQTFD